MGLELKDVVKRYGQLEVLHPFSLEITSGEFLTLLGPSGSGKTTVLRLIGGFSEVSDGKILFDGQDITFVPANKRPFNTVFQDYALFPHMTVLENAGYGPLVQKRSGATTRKLIDETLEIVGLSGLRDRYPSQLSGGQKQRVALARAIICEPKVILLDEPLAALDAALRRQMQVFLKQIQRRIRTTFVFVTHDQDEAITMSDRIVVMNEGRIEQIGDPKEIYFRPRTRFVAAFFGDNNIIPGIVSGPGKAQTSLGQLDVARSASFPVGAKVLVAIRPESFRLAKTGSGIECEVEDVMFGGPLTKLLVKPKADASLRIDVRLTGIDRATAPEPDAQVKIGYDPADAVVIAE
jgi:ABC-type Fe3+/spermidine/putrescine transport system ATPase subunit